MSVRKVQSKKAFSDEHNWKIVTVDEEKAKVSKFFHLSLHTKPHLTHLLSGWTGKLVDWRSKFLPTARDQICDHLKNLNIQKSMGCLSSGPRVVRELSSLSPYSKSHGSW